jgi:hypothetical protein
VIEWNIVTADFVLCRLKMDLPAKGFKEIAKNALADAPKLQDSFAESSPGQLFIFC